MSMFKLAMVLASGRNIRAMIQMRLAPCRMTWMIKAERGWVAGFPPEITDAGRELMGIGKG